MAHRTKSEMIYLLIFILLFTDVNGAFLTRPYLVGLQDLPQPAVFNDAEARGPQWYGSIAESGSPEAVSSSELDTLSGTSSVSSELSTESKSRDASSQEYKFSQRKLDRICTPCPHDMLKRWDNKGIRWICGRYQRARRSFKSECMMRYRNCEDGTMFVKMYERKCDTDIKNGRSWFYIYRV